MVQAVPKAHPSSQGREHGLHISVQMWQGSKRACQVEDTLQNSMCCMQAQRLPQCWCMVSTQWELEYNSLTKAWRSVRAGLLFLTNLKQQLNPQRTLSGWERVCGAWRWVSAGSAGAPPPWPATQGRPGMRGWCVGWRGEGQPQSVGSGPGLHLQPCCTHLQKSQIDRSKHCVYTQLKLPVHAPSAWEPPVCWFTTSVTQDS